MPTRPPTSEPSPGTIAEPVTAGNQPLDPPVLDPPLLVLPRLSDQNRHFWEGGRNGQLVFLRCSDCGYYLHPPIPICPVDRSKNLCPQPVSGRGNLASYTVNHHPWLPGFDPPYLVALVELVEQEGLRLVTNLVNCPFELAEIGMPVQAVFRHLHDVAGDVWLPLFEPVRPNGSEKGQPDALG